jgi:hypothetical protein
MYLASTNGGSSMPSRRCRILSPAAMSSGS